MIEATLRGLATRVASRATADLAMFKDHCVVNPTWLAMASGRVEDPPPPLEWHHKIRWALDLVAANARTIDQRVYLFPWAKAGDAATSIASHKRLFFTDQTTLDEVLPKTEQAYADLLGRLRDVRPDLRARALHTYAAAGSLRLIRILQRFEGILFSDAGRLVVRLFPDLPNLRRMKGPLVGLPFRHAVNGLAYGSDGDEGFLFCRINRGPEGDYKYLHLPRFDAETFQDAYPGPVHLYYGWVVPQWLLLCDDAPPAADAWCITVLRDEDGKERYTKHRESPWSGLSRDLPSEYEWSTTFYERAEIEPGIPCWVVRQAPDTIE